MNLKVHQPCTQMSQGISKCNLILLINGGGVDWGNE